MGQRIKLRSGNIEKCCVANTVFEASPIDRREKTLPSKSNRWLRVNQHNNFSCLLMIACNCEIRQLHKAFFVFRIRQGSYRSRCGYNFSLGAFPRIIQCCGFLDHIKDGLKTLFPAIFNRSADNTGLFRGTHTHGIN